MAAMKACCEGGMPAAEAKDPVGVVTTLGTLPIYETGEKGKSYAIVAAYDIFGFDVKRTKVVCDQIASALGCKVILPDFFRNDDVLKKFGEFPPPGGMEDLFKWLEAYPFDKIVAEIFDVVLPHLKSTANVEKLGIVGFCWGGKVTVLASGRPEVAAGVGMHPSFLNPEDVPAIQCPQMFLPAGNDPPIDPIWEAMKEKPFFDKCVSKVFSDMVHGWTLRRDPKNAKAVAQADEAIQMTIDFFKSNLET